MSISKKFKTIKTVNLFFIIILLLLANIPLKSLAAERWYYATTPEDTYAYAADIHGNLFTSSKKCNDDRTARIERDIIEQKTYSITVCVKSSKQPPVKGSELGVPFVPLQDVVEKWWFEYLNNETKTYYVLGPYTSKAKCETKWRETQQPAASSGASYSLHKACFQADTEPAATPPIGSVPLSGDGGGKPKDTETTYKPLAPLPDGTGNLMGDFDTKDPCPFGKYLNILIKLFIGIAAVLSMIMIVMGGIEYMTSGLVSSKEAAKHKITNAILGLILALGSYAILNTLNPKLLEVCLNNLPEAKITIQDEAETPDSAQSPGGACPVGSTTIGCKEGIVEIATSGGKFCLCKTIATGVQTLVNNGWKSGQKLSGGSFRSKQQQESLRAKNCGGTANIYNKNAKCNPMTAFPGTSRHENGLAVDFRCDNVLIQNNTNACFVWLGKNANGILKNFSKEPWHWSNDGK